MPKNESERSSTPIQTLARQLENDFIQSHQLAFDYPPGTVVTHDTTWAQRRYCEVVTRVLSDPLASVNVGDLEVRSDIHDIVVDGTLRDSPLIPIDTSYPSTFPHTFDSTTHYKYRQAVLGVYLRNSVTAETIVNDKILGLHGSGSASLISTLKNGLLPLGTLRKKGHLIPNGSKDNVGEEWIANSSVRFVPFTLYDANQVRSFFGRELSDEELEKSIQAATRKRRELVDLYVGDPEYTFKYKESKDSELGLQILELQAMRDFISRKPTDTEEAFMQSLARDNFPVVYAISNADLATEDCETVGGGISGEFAIKRSVGLCELPVIFVPRQKLSDTQAIIKEKGLSTEVFAIEDVPSLDQPKPVVFNKARDAEPNSTPEAVRVSVGGIRRFFFRHR